MQCKKCQLHKTRINIVHGQGNNKSNIILIGEAPGKNEDLQGIPFIGRAGKLLDELLSHINLTRKDVYTTNTVKCRPPNNRNPTTEEIKACTPHLDREIAQIKPKIIIPLGTFASKYILEKYNFKFTTIGVCHGKKFYTPDLIIIPFYHPAAAIYNQKLKPELFKDIRKVKITIDENN